MLWSLLSSAFVIYLYRKLAAEAEQQPTANEPTDLGSALDALNQRLASLEGRLTNAKAEETPR
jgi:hypothetical protein